MRTKFAEIGIAPGKPFDVAALSPETKAAFAAGMAAGQKVIDERRAATHGKMDDLFSTRAFLKNDNVARATGAQMGIGANSSEEAQDPIYEKGSSERPLDGSPGKYTLHFAKNQFPPVNAFWSLTMYNLPQQLLVRNPINRYLINAPMLPNLKLDADGGLTILHSNGFARTRQRGQLAAGAEWSLHAGDALLPAEAGAARRNVEIPGRGTRALIRE
jgi:hypothetical protein